VSNSCSVTAAVLQVAMYRMMKLFILIPNMYHCSKSAATTASKNNIREETNFEVANIRQVGRSVLKPRTQAGNAVPKINQLCGTAHRALHVT
jgi:hypothetical protein